MAQRTGFMSAAVSSRPGLDRCVTALLAAALVLVLGGCSRSEPQSRAGAAAATTLNVPSALVSVAWLVERLDDDRLVVIDARAPEKYSAGHIPGAVNVPLASTYHTDPARKDYLAPTRRIEELFGAAGVDMTRTVVLYDDQNYRDAARVFWALEVHGHPNAAVLNGGLNGWVSGGHSVSQAEARAPEPRRFVARLQPNRLASKLHVMRATTDPTTIVLDSRSPEEYLGETTSTSRAGHIPSAVNLNFVTHLRYPQPDVCMIDDAAALADHFAALPDTGRIITYCNTGTRASVSYLVLRALGRDAAVYDGSWKEWSEDANLPIGVGASAGADAAERDSGSR